MFKKSCGNNENSENKRVICEYLEFSVLYEPFYKLYSEKSHNSRNCKAYQQRQNMFAVLSRIEILQFNDSARQNNGNTEYERVFNSRFTLHSAEKSRRYGRTRTGYSGDKRNSLKSTYHKRILYGRIAYILAVAAEFAAEEKYRRRVEKRKSFDSNIRIGGYPLEKVPENEENKQRKNGYDDKHYHAPVIIHFAPLEFAREYVLYH